ncbi:16604_t:CDS:2 [Rhizophagus irregularis]|nr:16604_t:CDS:2 [Rhizophagus irregularis]
MILKSSDPMLLILFDFKNTFANCQVCKTSLGIDYIDLYYQYQLTEDTVALAELVQKEMSNNIGLSECSAETLRCAYKVHPIAAVQKF